MELSKALLWRYATKAMNGQRVDPEKIERILEAIRYAPTSNGLQPFEVIVVSNPEWKKKIRTVANNQSVATDSSHLVIFAAWDDVTPERIDAAFEHTIRERGNYQGLESYRQSLINIHTANTKETNFNHAARQAYIALGFGLLAAADQQVDTTPMEGFDPAAVDELLGLHQKALRSVAMMAIGYRDEKNDWLVGMKKVRKPASVLITTLD
jgi:nitroreductase / dihydropteridine reductase